MPHNQIEHAKHVTDVIIASAGIGATIVYWIDSFINPALTAGATLMTIIWLYYRVQRLRDERADRRSKKKHKLSKGQKERGSKKYGS